jgi:hypothetical protein
MLVLVIHACIDLAEREGGRERFERERVVAQVLAEDP